MRPVVLVTGASRGIGAATAKFFASHDYDIVLNYCKNMESALQVEREILEEFSVRVCCMKADVSAEEEVSFMIDQVIEKFGRLDVVVNNAGIAIDTIFEDKTIDQFRKILDVNLIGTFLVSKYASHYMKKGSIVNVSSTNGMDSYYPYSMDYDSSKAGVNLLTKNLAVEFGPNIRVNAVAPGWVMTEMNSELSEEFMEEEKKKIVLDRFAEPIEIAKVIYFLASEDASYLNGVILPVDGGRK